MLGTPEVAKGATTMKKILKRSASVLAALSLLSGGALVLSAPAANAAVCGWSPLTTPGVGGGSDDKDVQKGIYNHCGNGNVKIRVVYHYATKDFCVSPGETTLWANPNLGALHNAYYIGGC